MLNRVKLLELTPPVSEIPAKFPELPARSEARLQLFAKKMKDSGLDQVVSMLTKSMQLTSLIWLDLDPV